MESDYGQAYAELYRQHWWWRAREGYLVQLFQQLPLPPQPRVLDIGCGDGLFFDRLLQLGGTVEGLESEAALVSAATQERYAVHIGPFDESFSTNQNYSLVLMLDVLEHLPNPLAALQQATKLLASDGRLVITVPAFMSLWTTHDELNHHLTRYTKATLSELISQTALQIDQQRYFFHWLAPLKLATRLKEKIVATPPQPPRIPSPWLNRWLLSFASWEQKIFSRASLPFGSSLLMVCRRKE